MGNSTPLQKLQSIQALRGLAAFLVLIFHAANVQKARLSPDRVEEYAILSGFWDQGYAGVDMFFVISGFIMVYVTAGFVRNRNNILRFLYARVSRIYPLWWVCAALMMVYFWVSYGQPAPPDRVGAGAVVPYSIRSLLLIPQDQLPVLGVGWTLIHEMFFYLVFAALLCLPRKTLPFGLLLWAGLILIFGLLGSTPPMAQSFIDLAISPLTLEFIAGGLVGWFILRGARGWAKPVTLLALLALIIAFWLGIEEIDAGLAWKRVWAYTLPCAGLVYGLVILERESGLKLPTWAVKLGDWSYSLYLTHMLVLLALRRIWQAGEGFLPAPLTYHAEGMWDNLAFATVGIVLAVIVSGLSYRYVEKPLLIGARRFYPKPETAKI